MFKNRKTNNRTNPTAPEYWLPVEMRERASDIARIRHALSPLTERGWQEYIEQESITRHQVRVDLLIGPYLTERDEPHEREDVAAVRREILEDPSRAWEAYATIRIHEQIAEMFAAEKEKEKQEKDRIRTRLCPVCRKFSDTDHIGSIRPREMPLGQSLRSCEACHVVAHALVTAEYAAAKTENGSRVDSVRAHLASGGLTVKAAMHDIVRALSADAPSRAEDKTTRQVVLVESGMR